MPVVEGQAADGGTFALPLNADGTAVLTEGTAGGGLPAGAATAARQDTGNASLETIATNTTGVATAANQTNGTQRVKTSAPTSTHIGANVATSSTSAALTSQPTTIGYIIVTALLANTAPIFLARGAGVTTGTGLELNPGDSLPLPCENANEWHAISAAAQNLRFVAV